LPEAGCQEISREFPQQQQHNNNKSFSSSTNNDNDTNNNTGITALISYSMVSTGSTVDMYSRGILKKKSHCCQVQLLRKSGNFIGEENNGKESGSKDCTTARQQQLQHLGSSQSTNNTIPLKNRQPTSSQGGAGEPRGLTTSQFQYMRNTASDDTIDNHHRPEQIMVCTFVEEYCLY